MDEELAELALYILAFVLVAGFGSAIHAVTVHIIGVAAERWHYRDAAMADNQAGNSEALEEQAQVLRKAARHIVQIGDDLEAFNARLEALEQAPSRKRKG